jgi:hypothetical protein
MNGFWTVSHDHAPRGYRFREGVGCALIGFAFWIWPELILASKKPVEAP